MNNFLRSLGNAIPAGIREGHGLSVEEVSTIEEAVEHACDSCFPFSAAWGSSMGLCTDRPDECLMSWCDLRELMVAKHIKTSTYFGNKDLYSKEEAFRDYIEDTIEIDWRVDELSDEIMSDLGFCAMNDELNQQRPNFWSHLSTLFQHGLIPCGWRGVYPDGSYLVLALPPE